MSEKVHYIALGDNLSVDMFAGGPGHGAASLLYRNRSEFPEFAERDLRSRFPGLVHTNLARDGATIAAVSLGQMSLPEEIRGDIRVVTLTAGFNDFIRIWGAELQTGEVAANDLRYHLDEILSELREIGGDEALILVGNIYDPTDGTGDYETFGTADWDDGQVILDLFNRTIANAADDADALLVDLRGHFLGHGFGAEDPDNPHYHADDPTHWYVQRAEANARGASEIRRCFWARVEEMFPAAS